jgi:beta-lactamase regulating signal transducer with metallopeptidase domain
MENIFKLFLEMTMLASVMIGIVWAVRAVCSKRISPTVIISLWIAVLLRLCIPLTFDSPVHVGDLWPERPAEVHTVQPVESAAISDTYGETASADNVEASDISTGTNGTNTPTTLDTETLVEPNFGENVRALAKRIPVWSVLAGIWILGIAYLLLLTVKKAFTFKRRLLASKRIEDNAIIDIVNAHKKRLGIRGNITVLECDSVETPAIFGYFRPYLLLPAAFLRDVDKRRIGHILLHELCHIKRKDVLGGYLWLAAKLLHWFNPLVWLAYRLYRDDVELCCDQMVIRYLGEDDRYEYSRTLIDVIRVTKRCGAIATAVAFCENKEKLKERVVRMISPRERSRFAFIVSMMLALTMIITCFTTACRAKSGDSLVIDPSGEAGDIIYADGYVEGQDSQYWYSNQCMDYMAMADDGKGYYFIEEGSSILCYKDKETGKAAPVFSRVTSWRDLDEYYYMGGPDDRFTYQMDMANGETHVYTPGESEPETIEKIYLYHLGENNVKDLIYYNGTLYCLSDDSYYGDILYEIDLTQAAPKPLFTIGRSRTIRSIAFHRGYVYYMEESDNYSIGHGTANLYRVPIADMAAGPELIYTIEGNGPTGGKLLCYGNYIYFDEHYNADLTEDSDVRRMNRYNIKDGSIQTIIEDNVGAYYTIFNGRLAYSAPNGTYLCDLDGKNSERILDQRGILWPGGEYLLIDNYLQALIKRDQDVTRTVYVYDTDGHRTGSVQLDGWKGYPEPIGVVDGMYIVPDYDDDTGITIYSMSVDGIADGTAVPEIFSDTGF